MGGCWAEQHVIGLALGVGDGRLLGDSRPAAQPPLRSGLFLLVVFHGAAKVGTARSGGVLVSRRLRSCQFARTGNAVLEDISLGRRWIVVVGGMESVFSI